MRKTIFGFSGQRSAAALAYNVTDSERFASPKKKAKKVKIVRSMARPSCWPSTISSTLTPCTGGSGSRAELPETLWVSLTHKNKRVQGVLDPIT